MHYSVSKRSVVVIALFALLAAISYVRIIINYSSLAVQADEVQHHDDNNGQPHYNNKSHNRRRLNFLSDAMSPPASVSTKTITDADALNAQSSSSSYDYSVLLISYHKTGHDLQEDLVNLLINDFPPPIGPNITAKGVKSLVRRRMHNVHLCSRLYVQPGTVAVQHAPDFFCSAEKLAKILLEEGPSRRDDGNININNNDRGLKIVHLVRNPFTMAVSNYHYHAKKPIPKPEMWITRQNPCEVTYPNGELYADYVLPSLSKKTYEALNINYDSRLILRSEFEAISNDCISLYQKRKGLENANQFEHLMNLDAPDGLRLATAELTIQGYDNGGDMLRMSNNILKLKQAEKIVQNSWMGGGHNKEFQVYTLSLDDFISQPKQSALEFLNFVFDDQNHEANDTMEQKKESAATKYEQGYLAKKEGSRHITDGKTSNTEQLKEYLRRDPVFGPPIQKIEMLVETALADSRNTVVS